MKGQKSVKFDQNCPCKRLNVHRWSLSTYNEKSAPFFSKDYKTHHPRDIEKKLKLNFRRLEKC